MEMRKVVKLTFHDAAKWSWKIVKLNLKDYWRCQWVNLVEGNRNLPYQPNFPTFSRQFSLKSHTMHPYGVIN
jgi:hypothetical protein